MKKYIPKPYNEQNPMLRTTLLKALELYRTHTAFLSTEEGSYNDWLLDICETQIENLLLKGEERWNGVLAFKELENNLPK